MGKKHLTFKKYLMRMPKEYHNKIILLEPFRGNRTNISFIFSCGCKVEQSLKAFLLRDRFDYCSKCKYLDTIIYVCKYCRTEFVLHSAFEKCQNKCENKYKNLILGEDYVICSICGFHGKSLSNHLHKIHNIDPEEYKKLNQIICIKSSNTYRDQNIINTAEWRQNIKDRGEGALEYLKKMGDAVRESILSNPAEQARRAQVMSNVNKSDLMRRKASETAKKTSARPEILEARTKNLARWRKENPELFFEKCIKKMITTFQSKPEIMLFEFVSSIDGFNFKRNQFINSKIISNKSNNKQIDMGDKLNRIYIEFDGVMHFKPTRGQEILNNIQNKDRQLERHIINHNWLLIRISYDQFIDAYKQINKIKYDVSYFKPECLSKIVEILNNKIPGVYKIGEAYGKY